MSRFDLSDDELQQTLTTVLHEHAASVSERVPVERAVIGRARRRRNVKLASLGSGLALGVTVMIVAVLSLGSSPLSSSKNAPASHGPAVRLTTPTLPPPDTLPHTLGWAPMADVNLAPRSASATAIAANVFVVWGGEGANGNRLTDGAWLDIPSGVWYRMRPSPLPPPSYPNGQHFVIAQALGDGVVIVSDGAAAMYRPRTDRWTRLPDVPLTRLDNLALNGGPISDVVVLTGVDREGHAAYAELSVDALSRLRWTASTLTGRSAGRPALSSSKMLSVVVRAPDGREELDRVSGLSGPAKVVAELPTQASSFVPTAFTGTAFVGSDCARCASNTLALVDVRTGALKTVRNAYAYNACAGLHVWTGKFIVSYGTVGCALSEVAYNPGTGATTTLASAPIAPRRFADFAVAPDGQLFVWGGEDVAKHKLANGAVLTLP